MSATVPSVHHLSGMAHALAGYALLTGFDTLLKLVSRHGYPQPQMMLTSGLVYLATIVALALLSGGLRRLATTRLRIYALRGYMNLVGFFAGFYALRHIPLADFYGIIFAVPILIVILSALWLHEHVGWRRWLAVACGFAGVMVMLHGGAAAATTAEKLGYGAALVCALLGAVTMVMVRRYGGGESSLSFPFYTSLCHGSVTAVIVALQGWQSYAWPDFVLLAAAGCICAIGSALLVTAYQHTPPSAVAPFQYTQMLWGVVLGYVLFHDVPTATVLLGAAVVIASGWTTLWREAKIAREIKRGAAA